MTTPTNPPATPLPRNAVNELQMRSWLRLREELAELHARLEYLKLMMVLRVGKR